MTTLPKDVTTLLARATEADFSAWRRNIVRLGGCTNPIHLVGGSDLVDAASGEVLW
jgi:hypothetical protein